jgi:predicted kinase
MLLTNHPMDRPVDVEDEFVGVLLDMFPGTIPSHLSNILKRSNFDLQIAIDQLLSAQASGDLPKGESCASEAEQMLTSGSSLDKGRPKAAAPNRVRLVVLVGLPGSGKSTFAEQFADAGWAVVCQDVLGNRKACEEAADAALAAGRQVVVDRTNIDTTQRAHWLRIAHAHGIGPRGIVCVHLDPPPRECERRVLARTGHPTLPPTPQSAGVVRSFRRALQRPSEAEGFARVLVVRSDADALRAARALME